MVDADLKKNVSINSAQNSLSSSSITKLCRWAWLEKTAYQKSAILSAAPATLKQFHMSINIEFFLRTNSMKLVVFYYRIINHSFLKLTTYLFN